MKEEWKDISGYESVYQVSNYGNVRRVRSRYGAIQEKKICRQLKPRRYGSGYLSVCLSWKRRKKYIGIHRLVAMEFIEQRSKDQTEVNHKDGNKHNNHVRNLEWVTCQENKDHASRTGLLLRGEDNPAAKLTKQQAIEIRKLCSLGKYTLQEIGDMFGISGASVGDLVRGETWSNLGPPIRTRVSYTKWVKTKISNEQVIQIRKTYKKGKTRIVDIAYQFDISKSQVWNIITNNSRTDI